MASVVTRVGTVTCLWYSHGRYTVHDQVSCPGPRSDESRNPSTESGRHGVKEVDTLSGVPWREQPTTPLLSFNKGQFVSREQRTGTLLSKGETRSQRGR